MKRRIHASAAVLSALFLATFWISTLTAELFLSLAAVTEVKQLILYALPVFVPLMMITAGTGLAMGGKGRHPLFVMKRRRMPFIGINGMLILVPSALFLAIRAKAGVFDGIFYSVQLLELLAGALNLTLIGMNIRDGLRLSSIRHPA